MILRKVLQILPISVIIAIAFLWIPAAQALTVTPARIEITADPGTTVSGNFTLINEEQDSKTFYSSAENFEAQGESGTPSFTSSTEGLSSWISLSPSVSLKKSEELSVPFSIKVPAGTEPGGYFAAIFLSTTPVQAQKSEVSVGARIGVLILLHVNGVVKEGGGILDFTTNNTQHVFAALPVNLAYRFRNSGADRVEPVGTLTIKNMFGGVSSVLQANPQQGNVLPNSTRRYDITWGEGNAVPSGFFAAAGYEMTHFKLGYYTIQLALQYGSKNTQGQASLGLFIIPWQLLLIILVGLLIIFFVLKIFLRRYNNYIIAQARKSNK